MPPVDYSPLVDRSPAPRGVNPDAHAVQRFAEVNGWQYFTHATEQPLPGAVFRATDGTARYMQRAVNIVRLPGEPMIEAGDSAYNSTVQMNVFSENWGYVAVQIGGALPSVLAEVDRLRAIRAVPSMPAGAEHRTVGERGRGVTVHRRAQDAAWVDGVFTDDVCAALDDGSVGFDVELAPGWLFFYTPGSLRAVDPAVWQRVFALIDLLRARIAGTPAVASAAPSIAVPHIADAAPPAAVPGPPTVPASPSRTTERTWATKGPRTVFFVAAVVIGMALAVAGVVLFGPN